MIFDIKSLSSLTMTLDFESQNFTIFTDKFIIGLWFAKDLLKQDSAYNYSINPGFDAENAEKFLNGV